MGIYLNPGSDAFREAIRSEIYVDKTGMIAYTNSVLNTRQKFICVSRPRRFGKTTALDMLAAYYDRTQDAREVFGEYEIASDKSFEEHRNRFDVLRINMINFFSRQEGVQKMLDMLESRLLKDLRRAYRELDDEEEWTLASAMEEICAVHHRQFVVIIDEWDCVFRETQDDKDGQVMYLDYLRDWLKDKTYIALAYMTGILPIKKYGKHSALNMFNEYSMISAKSLTPYTGFTDEEVRALCERYMMDPAAVRNWYDGYRMSYLETTWDENGKFAGEERKQIQIYSPRSVVECMRNREFENYWNKTETFEALKIYIEMNYEGLRDTVIALMAGDRKKVATENFQNDMTTFVTADDVLTLLVHIGYLGYDAQTGEVFIPNKEVSDEYVNATRTGNWEEVRRALGASEQLLADMLAGNAEAVAGAIENVHLETSHLQYNDENALSYTIALACYSARQYYTVVRELPSGKGFADMVFLPRPQFAQDYPALVIELKWNREAETAIHQIKEKQYVKTIEGYTGKMLLVGISYDKKTRKHFCEIEEG